MLDSVAGYRETAFDILAQVDSQYASPALCQHLEVSSRLGSFHDPEGVFSPGTATSSGSSHVICRNTPVFGPPLYACPVECKKRGPKPTQVAARVRSRTSARISVSTCSCSAVISR